MTAVGLGLLIGLQLKHFVADYLLQPGWMLAGKGDLRQPGGYAHAGLHAVLSAVVLAIFCTPAAVLAVICLVEFVLHYVLDFGKAHYSAHVEIDARPQRFWALHGVDQLAHQLTYAAMIYVALGAPGFA